MTSEPSEYESLEFEPILDNVHHTLCVPTRGVLWGNTSNPLKFALDERGSVWFTEWGENKFGVLQSSEIADLPLWLTVSKK